MPAEIESQKCFAMPRTDLITKAIQAALGEPINADFSEHYTGHWAEVVLHAEKTGVFQSLWISEEIRENVVEEDLWIRKSAVVRPFKAANEALGTLVLRFQTQEALEKVMAHISNYVRVQVD